jgi:cytidine deaminase
MKLIFFPKTMKKLLLPANFAYSSLHELPNDIQNLMEQAVAVRKSHALFKIRVGAALLLMDKLF